MADVFVMLPITITAAMIGAGTTIAEPASGETVWVSGGTYAVGDQRIRVETHKVYECVLAASARTVAPESDPSYWEERGPTLRWAVFDDVVMTKSTATTSFTYVVSPGFFNAIRMYGLDGGSVSITCKDAPGGNVYFSYTGTPQQCPIDEYDYYFGPIVPLSKLGLTGLLAYPNAEVTITISAATGITVGCGKIAFGDMMRLLSDTAAFGGTRHGAEVEPISFSYIKVNDDGTAKIKKRGGTTGMHIEVVMPKGSVDRAVEIIQRVLDVGACWVGSTMSGRTGLDVFGLGTARATYDEEHDTLICDVKGLA